jgi:hypothetical protein
MNTGLGRALGVPLAGVPGVLLSHPSAEHASLREKLLTRHNLRPVRAVRRVWDPALRW